MGRDLPEWPPSLHALLAGVFLVLAINAYAARFWVAVPIAILLAMVAASWRHLARPH